MTSSTFCRLLKDNISTETKRSNFIKKLRPSQTRSVLVTKLSLAVEISHVKEYFNQHFGEVEKVTFHHTRRNDYTKCVVVRMKKYDAAQKILAEENHEILSGRVCVELVSESTQIKKPPFPKGRYKLKLTRLDTDDLLDIQLNDIIEDAFADLGHHTAIDLWKDGTNKLDGTAEIKFVNKEDALKAAEIAMNNEWGAELFGPRTLNGS